MRHERVVGDANTVVARSCWRGKQTRTIATGFLGQAVACDTGRTEEGQKGQGCLLAARGKTFEEWSAVAKVNPPLIGHLVSPVGGSGRVVKARTARGQGA